VPAKAAGRTIGGPLAAVIAYPRRPADLDAEGTALDALRPAPPWVQALSSWSRFSWEAVA